MMLGGKMVICDGEQTLQQYFLNVNKIYKIQKNLNKKIIKNISFITQLRSNKSTLKGREGSNSNKVFNEKKILEK